MAKQIKEMDRWELIQAMRKFAHQDHYPITINWKTGHIRALLEHYVEMRAT